MKSLPLIRLFPAKDLMKYNAQGAS